MSMKTFRYLGPDTAVTFRGGQRVRLLNGHNAELPEESKFVRDLLARKMLEAVEAPSSPEPKTTGPEPTSSSEVAYAPRSRRATSPIPTPFTSPADGATEPKAEKAEKKKD